MQPAQHFIEATSLSRVFLVSNTIIISRLRYALPAWAGFLTKEAGKRIDAFLRRMFQHGHVVIVIVSVT